MNRIAHHFPPPEPDPNQPQLDAMSPSAGQADPINDLVTPREMDMGKQKLPGRPAGDEPGRGQKPFEPMPSVPRSMQPPLTPEDLETVVEAGQTIQSQHDQSQAPPVDNDLVAKCVNRELPEAERLAVWELILKWKTWAAEASLVAQARNVRRRAADSN